MNGYLALAGLQTVKPATAEEYVMQKVLEFASPVGQETFVSFAI